MTTYTVIGDPHAKPDNLDKIGTLFNIIEELGNPCIILGDLLDTKELIRGRCLELYVERIKNSKLHFTILVGNHDRFNVNVKEHSLFALSLLPNVTLVEDALLGNNSMAFISFCKEPEDMRKMLNWASGCKYLFCHADIKNFDYGNGILSSEGLEEGDFSEFKLVISGHYHKYSKRGNITYLGTPFTHSFGESNQEKFIGLFNSKTGNLELLPSPFPAHQTINVLVSKGNIPVEIQNPEYTRVILIGNPELVASYPRIEGVKYIEETTQAETKAIVTEQDPPEVQFEKWAKDIKNYSDELLKLGKEILADVSKN